jgi:hypothetical protein
VGCVVQLRLAAVILAVLLQKFQAAQMPDEHGSASRRLHVLRTKRGKWKLAETPVYGVHVQRAIANAGRVEHTTGNERRACMRLHDVVPFDQFLLPGVI